MMQDDSVFINTARGAIINQEEMIEVLSNRNIRAFLDVYTVEPLEADSPLRKMKNIRMYPIRPAIKHTPINIPHDVIVIILPNKKYTINKTTETIND